MLTVCEKIQLLIWKNYLLRKKHPSDTGFLILIPVVVIFYVAFISYAIHGYENGNVRRNQKSMSGSSESRVFSYGSIEKDESDSFDINPGVDTSNIPLLVNLLFTNDSKLEETEVEIAYSPFNAETSRVMQEVLKVIKDHSNGNVKDIHLKNFPTESKIENYLKSWKGKSPEWKPFKVAVIFPSKLNSIKKADSKVQYKIRFVDPNGNLSTENLRQPPEGHSNTEYKWSGFTALQILTDNILIKRMTEGLKNDFPRIVQGRSRKNNHGPSVWQHLAVYYYLPHSIILSFVICVPKIIRQVISEKQSGIKELMQMMGLSHWMHWAGWMLDSLFFMGISAVLITLYLFYPISILPIVILQFSSMLLLLFVMLLYLMATITFCFFISTFFSDATLAIMIGTCCYVASYYGLVFTLDADDYASTLTEKIVSSLLPNMALHWAIKVILSYEVTGVGARWWNIAIPINEIDKLSMLPVCLMLILDTILYMALTMYLENVLPSQFGLRKPWNYIFQRSTWIAEKTEKQAKTNESAILTAVDNSGDGKETPDGKIGLEEEPMDLPIEIEICDLTKEFDRHKMALDGISAKIYKGEITALLGFNGAGKTTIVSILAGLLLPTSGTAFIKDYDVTLSMKAIRTHMGLCPQHDMLLDELTVEQHLEFFGLLKGYSPLNVKEEAQKIILRLKLSEETDVQSKNLSRSQKKRLCIANAVIGISSVLILDEPTTGLDPEEKREVWDLLLALRGQRTIVLATSSLEEADFLGDRIVIMAEGKIQCCGTSLFLKKQYGNGYSIMLTTEEGADANAILSVAQKYIPQAFIDASKYSSNSEFTITLPEESISTSVFPNLFGDLAKEQQKLRILTIGTSIATMDDVFVNVGELNRQAGSENDLDKYEDVSKTGADNRQGLHLFVLMFWGLMIKLFLRNIRNAKVMLFQILPPIIAIILVCSMASNILREVTMRDYTPLKISRASYENPNPISICKPRSEDAKRMCDSFALAIGGISTTTILPVDEELLVDYLRNESHTDLAKYRTQYVIAAEMTETKTERKIKVMHSPFYYHSEPLAINAASNTVLKLLTNNSAKSIEVINHPLKRIKPEEVFSAAESLFDYETYFTKKSAFPIAYLFCLLVPLGLVFLAASYVIFPTEERLSNGKQLQRIAGVSPWLYWTCAFLWDFIMMILLTVILLICVYIFQPYQIFTYGDAAGVFFLIFLVYYFSVIPLSYLTSTLCSSETRGYTKLVKYHVATALIFAPITCIMEIVGIHLSNYSRGPNAILSMIALALRILFSVNPTFGFVLSLLKFSILSLNINRCNVLLDNELFCKKYPTFFENSSVFSGCCASAKCSESHYTEDYCHFKKDKEYCHVKPKYLEWEFRGQIGILTPLQCDWEKLPGIGQELLAMFIMGVIYYIFLFMIEYKILDKAEDATKISKLFASLRPTDDDVIDEAARVDTQVSKRPQGNQKKNSAQHAEDPMANNTQNTGTPGNNEVDGQMEVESTSNHSTNKIQTDAVAVEIEAEEQEDALLVQGLCKAYKDFTAVSHLSFGVKHGECFGLLGGNGAGKTATFRILTGDEPPSLGQAIAEGFTLRNNKSNFVRQFGYCPQTDASIPFMTGKEMLMFYGRLRGVPPNSLNREVDMWLAKLGLTESANVVSMKYSGGMKRRLGAGMALVGRPPIILLDEPTSGVDPFSRRQIWKIISSVKEDGHTVIFTSQSMEECGALCSRLGIMVNGLFEGFGGVQHLKNKFGRGHFLAVKLKIDPPGPNREENARKDLENTKLVTELRIAIMESKFQKLILKDQHSNVLQYLILDAIPVSEIFKVMEELKERFPIIEEYSVGDITLEQVFQSFDIKQYARHTSLK